MSDARNSGADPHPGNADPAAAMLAVQQMWELPLMLYMSWWNAGLEAMCAHMPPHHCVHHDEHAQLVVPEPIEADGEHALFA